jgi:hypothetical protein
VLEITQFIRKNLSTKRFWGSYMDVKQIFSLIRRWLWLLILGSVIGTLFTRIQKAEVVVTIGLIFSGLSSRILSWMEF